MSENFIIKENQHNLLAYAVCNRSDFIKCIAYFYFKKDAELFCKIKNKNKKGV